LLAYNRYADSTNPVSCVIDHPKKPNSGPLWDALNKAKSSFIVKTDATGEQIHTYNAWKGDLPVVELQLSSDTTGHIAFRCMNSDNCHKKARKDRYLNIEILDNKRLVFFKDFISCTMIVIYVYVLLGV